MRCGLCGSKQVGLITASSYSMKKGIVGAAVLGPVGAVAGINGKQSMKYHCTACGQDSLSVLDARTENEIDELLAKGDIEALKKYKSRWKNIEGPTSSALIRHYDETHPSLFSDNNTGAISVPQNSGDSISSLSEQELKNQIKDDLSSRDLPYTEEELYSKYSANKKYINVYKDILKEGSAHAFWINGKKYIKPAKNLEDISQFALMSAAEICNRSDISNTNSLIDEIKQIIKNKNTIPMDELVSEFEERHPECAIAGNQYAFSSLVESIIDLLCDRKAVQYDGTAIKVASFQEHEKYLYEKVYGLAEGRNKKKMEIAEKDNLRYKNRMIRALNESASPIRITEVFAVENQRAVALMQRYLQDMCTKGKVEKITPPGEHITRYRGLEKLEEYFVPFDMHEDLTLLHNQRTGDMLFGALREEAGKDLTFSEIIEAINEKYNKKIREDSNEEVDIFIELLYYLKTFPYYQNVKYFKNMKKDGESYWRFIDRDKEEFNRLSKERANVEKSIEDIEQKLVIAEKEHAENIRNVESFKFKGDPALEKQIYENVAKIKELEEAHKEIHGIFKKKRLEENERNLKELADFNDKMRSELSDKKNEAEERISKELNRTNAPLLELQDELKKQKERLHNIDIDLGKINVFTESTKADEATKQETESTEEKLK